MRNATGRTTWGAILTVATRVAVLGAGLALAGCQTDGTGVASSGSGASRTLAFESIDGPPKDTFDRLVTRLSSEAELKQVAVVSRGQTAGYRIRGYLAVHTERGKTQVAYAWDVFDADKQRVARITGEETTKAVKGNAWAACDEEMLARIAGNTMASLSESLSMGSPRTAPAAPAQTAAPVAAAPAEPAPAAAEPPAAAPAPAIDPRENGGVPVAMAPAFGSGEGDGGVLAYAAR